MGIHARKPLGAANLPELYLRNLPDIFGITRKEGKTTLVCASSPQEALRKYNDVVTQFPDSTRPTETLESVCMVQAIR